MQVSISARHGQLSESTREKVGAKFEKLTRIFERLTAITVTIDLQDREALIVEALVSAEHKHDFVARESAATPEMTMDLCVHKIEQQLRRYKEKVQHHKGDVTHDGPARRSPESYPSSEKSDSDSDKV